MRKMIISFACLILMFQLANAQTRIDSSFAFQNDPDKDFSIYIPSSYDENVPTKLMVALHPWNTSRWNSSSWCDTLLVFAETNNLLMICPDGGSDGQISDPIDTAFTSLLIDEIQDWYNVDSSSIFLMGFSWGGQVTYSYGLDNPEVFKGYMPIGAAINGVSEFSSVLSESEDERFYLVHGSDDSPGSRYYPALDSLQANEACVNSNFLSGVAHTIDFPNRNQILSDAFVWLDTVSCGPLLMDTTSIDTTGMDTTVNVLEVESLNSNFIIYPNPAKSGQIIEIKVVNTTEGIDNITLFDLVGRQIRVIETDRINVKIFIDNLEPGQYFIELSQNERSTYRKLIVY